VVAAFILAIAYSPAMRADAAQIDATDEHAEREYDKLIISGMPKRKSKIYRVIAKLLGKAKGEVLAMTQSEVWSVPDQHAKALAEQLKQLGTKVALLSEDWNHILRRYTKPLAMSPAQEEMLKRAREAKEFVGYGIMKAADAVTAEYALTVGGTARLRVGKGPPKDTVSRIVLPINETQQITIQRQKVVSRPSEARAGKERSRVPERMRY
jgi:hypothetical protein